MAWSDEHALLDLPAPALPGPHQIDNAGLAIAAALALEDPRIRVAAIARGLQAARWPARLQRITAGPFGEAARARGADLWLDGGHNPHAARALAEAVAEMAARDGRPTVLIAGLLANKDADAWFAALAPLRPEVLTVGGYADAAAEPERLAAQARAAGLAAEACANVDLAVTHALATAGAPPRIVIAGSLYLAGEVLGRSRETWPV
jgi:dihydrofolate synthase/folylpolyglutamate synthase